MLGYVFAGGMRGTAWANTFQTAVFMVLGVVTFVVIAREIGGGETFLESLQGATARVLESHPEKLVMKPPRLFFLSFLLIPLSQDINRRSEDYRFQPFPGVTGAYLQVNLVCGTSGNGLVDTIPNAE